MSGNSSVTPKVAVPSPLPSRRGVVMIPKTLKEDIMSSLVRRNSPIHNIHSTLSSSLRQEGWIERLNSYIENLIIHAGEDINDEEIYERVTKSIMANFNNENDSDKESSLAETEFWKGETSERQGLSIPRKAVDDTVEATNKELQDFCTVVDSVDWQAT